MSTIHREIPRSGVSPMTGDQRLRVLVISMLYEPDCVGIAAIAADMCAALAARGHDMSVYTTYPYYPEWKHKSDVSCWRVQREVIRDVDVRRYGLFVPANPSRLLPRLLHELSFPVSLLRSLPDRREFDVVMAFCPLLGTVMFSALRKMFFREPLWVNIQDIPVQAAAASGIIRSKVFEWTASRLQKTLFDRGDVWSSISPQMVRQLQRVKPTDTPLHLCPNWLIHSLHEEVRELPSKLGQGPRHTPQLLYCGTIGKKQGLLELCQQLSRSELDFNFSIRGHGGEAEKCRQWLDRAQDSRFNFAELLSDAEFVRAIHAADWFVIPQKSSFGNSFFPSKLIPSICVGTPILAVSDSSGPLGEEVSEHGLGIVMQPSELDQLPDALASFQRDPSRFHTLQRNCLNRAQAYDRGLAIDRIERLLQELSITRTRKPRVTNGK